MFLLWFMIIVIVIATAVKLYLILTCGICRSSAHLVGKTAVVTGANSGIGFETALDFAARGAKVILACRSETLGRQARQKIIEATNNQQVIYKYIDLGSLTSVREFANDIIKNEKRLDILVNNAGAGGLPDKITSDGLHLGLQVNYFAPYLLARLLEPLLRVSAPSRIVNVSSSFHRFGEVDFTNLNMERKWNGFNEYVNSKLFNILMTVEHSRRLRGSGVVSNALHPGIVATQIFRHLPNRFVRDVTNYMINSMFKSPWQGAQTTVYVSVSPDLARVSGKYFSDCKEVKTSAVAMDSEVAKKLWDETEKLVKLK